MIGICTSIRIASNVVVAAASTAAWPFSTMRQDVAIALEDRAWRRAD